MAALLLSAGCKGCSEDKPKPPTEKEKPQENFEVQTPVTLPGYYPIDPVEKKKLEKEAKDDEKKRKLLQRMDPAIRFNRTKLGHWVSVDFLAIANNFNADGYLQTTTLERGQPALINGTDYFVQTSRPVNLVKGDWKKLETSVFMPRRPDKGNVTSINYLLNNGGSLPAINLIQPHNTLQDYQYHMVLLSSRPDDLKYISFLDCVRLPQGEASTREQPEFYSVVATTPGRPIPLPSSSLNWTTIGYLVWDDLDPDDLSRAQQEALVDWLHFGGQIIFSGPDCIDRLQSSFLAAYLPGQFEESISLGKSDVAELNANWAIAAAKNKNEQRQLTIQDSAPLPAIRFKPHVDASFIEGTSGLVLERRIGRGRVVASAFSLNNRQITSWRSFTSFFHNALLRKPHRRFLKQGDWGLVTFRYDQDRTSIYDPLTGSTLRYISRDLANNAAAAERAHTYEGTRRPDDFDNNFPLADQAFYEGMGSRPDYLAAGTGLDRNADDFLHYGGFQSFRQSGVAGWNDDGIVANRARETLKKAARITPPSANFVMKMLGLYLLVLVPINWLIFRLIGKVEWAWIAAPIIAISGAFLVVRYASLDIGFVRSVTHVGMVELQGDFDRGHLTDYAALYTSLSTGYGVELDNLSGQSLPFANVSTDSFRKGEQQTKVELARTTSTELKNYLVRSNSTGLLHTEMMLDVGGAFRMQDQDAEASVENDTLINLQDAAVIRRSESGDAIEFAWIGSLDAGDSARLEFKPLGGEPPHWAWRDSKKLSGSRPFVDSIWESLEKEPNTSISLTDLSESVELQPNWARLAKILQREMANQGRSDVPRAMLTLALDELDGSASTLSGIFDCVASNLRLGPGEVRLIGHTDQKLDQSKYTPAATQASHSLLVVVHLKHAALPPCRRDRNALSDFFRGRSNIDQEEDSTIEQNFFDGTQ